MNSKRSILYHLVLLALVLVHGPALAQMEPSLMQDPLPRPGVASFRIHLATGIDLHYVVKGPIPAPGTTSIEEAMILIHGYSDSWRSFEEMLERLPVAGYDVPVFALDMRGHGASSESAAGAYSQGDFAADVAAFMDALNIQQAVVAGHSMGGFIAHKFAVEYPEKLKGLVLIATSATKAGTSLIDEMKTVIDTFVDDEPAPLAFINEFQASTFFEPPAPSVLHRYVAESLQVTGRTWKKSLDGMDREDHSDQLRQVTAPTLVLWGDQDTYFTRDEQEDLLRLLPDARLVIYPGAGHSLNVERASEVVKEIQSFVWERFLSQETSVH